MSTIEEKEAVVVAGEGARGAFQAGVLKNLFDKGLIDPDFIIGISSGAVNAVGYSHLGPGSNYKFWEKIKSIKDVYGVNYFSFWYKSGLLNTKKTQKMTDEIVFGNTRMCEGIVARSLALDGSVEYVSSHSRTKAYFANAAVDAIRIAGLVESRQGSIDAGASALTPLGEAIKRGATKIDVIIARPPVVNFWQEPKHLKALGYAFRSLDLTFFRILFNDLKIAHLKNQINGFKQIDINVHLADKYYADATDFNKCGALAEKGLFGNFTTYKLEDLF